MRYWTLNLVPGKPKLVQPKNHLQITHVAIKEVYDAFARTTLTLSQLGPDNKTIIDSVVIAGLVPGRVKFATVNLKLEQGVPIVLDVVGDNVLSLVGWHEEGPRPLQSFSSFSSMQKPSVSAPFTAPTPGPSGHSSKKRPREDDEDSDRSSKRLQTVNEVPAQAGRRSARFSQKGKKKQTESNELTDDAGADEEN
ncbi:peptidylprolyl isomerase fpr3 [Stygiomarasmius scandens]|uniref:Peptidylprolyl isomerase fpr3 n=1 Tax=Marasmiellus scandens TaxID=2682957 RepID=A0ABR1J4N9_9AGAR